MAPIKRKTGPTNESFARTKKPFEAEDRPSKRVRQDEDEKVDKSRPPIPKAPLIAKARDEEAAFPRGGASVLTPLELKQVQIEATRDVLFEQGATKNKTSENDGGDEDAAKTNVTKKRKPKSKNKQAVEKAEKEEDVVKIEGLNYKRLVPGSLVLGKVSQINPHDIALSLPNNLTGYIPITSISHKLTERIETLAQDEDSDAEAEIGEEDVDLKAMFKIGQYLRAYVISTSDDKDARPAEKARRRIELSIIPQQANLGLTAQELVPNSMIMASVISVEDHGLIMDIGMEELGIRGFMSSKETGIQRLSDIQEGTVFLSLIVGLNPNGKTVKLSADTDKFANTKKQSFVSDAPTIDAFLPGTLVEVLITDILPKGIVGKVVGSLDVTADLMHSGAGASGKDLDRKYKIGGKVRARILYTFPKAEVRKLGVSLLDHVITLTSQQAKQAGQLQDPLALLPLSKIVEEVTVRKVEPGIGLFVDLGVTGAPGFVHISRVRDEKIETLSETSGAYKSESVHRGRVLSYNSMDGVFLISLESKILEQPFLRVEDLKIGEIVTGKVEKLVINAGGIGGVLVNLAQGITGLVPEMHMADVALLNPEKKFKEGMSVTARVVSTNPSKNQIRLTLKKSLINSEAMPWNSYAMVSPGMQSPGTIVNVLSSGAVVQFYGTVRGFLPVSEMSEAYIPDATLHFKNGQVVRVFAVDVDVEKARLTVSCKDPAAFDLAQQTAFKKLKVGELISATVTEKSQDSINVEISSSRLRAVLPVGQLTDGSANKDASAAKKIRVGQTLQSLVVLDINEAKHTVVLSNKPSFLQAATTRSLLRVFGDVKEQRTVHGFVKNITPTAVFVQFAGGLTGLLPKGRLPQQSVNLPEFGLRLLQSVTVKVVSIDQEQKRFLLSMNDSPAPVPGAIDEQAQTLTEAATINPVDSQIKSTADLVVGKLTFVRITSIKSTQLNVELADNIQGRIDISQIFDSWDEIKDRKHPLNIFAPKQIVKVRILGMHDARNHRFLPISHRGGKSSVYELSAKKSDQAEKKSKAALTFDKVQKGSSWIGFVNNIGEDCLWVNLSPNVRGRIKAFDVSEDVSLMNDLEDSFPVGSAIKVSVTHVDAANNRLDLSARSGSALQNLSFDKLSPGMILPGKVTKLLERGIMIQLSESISAPVHLIDLADDFSEANPTNYSKNDIVRVVVVDVDLPNKRLRLSTRPSRVLNSSLPVEDAEVTSMSQLKVGIVVRGFVKNVSDKGLFINLGGNVAAYVRVADLSDSYLKDWKSQFQVDQLVKGKVTMVDEAIGHCQISLKASVLDKNYVPPITISSLAVGQIVTGKVRKVEDFGVFIVVDNSANVSGLCHKSEMADKRVEDVKKLYEEGDVVQAIVLKLEKDTKRVNFGLKASYFSDAVNSDDDSDDDSVEGMNGVELGSGTDDDDEVDEVEENDEADLDVMDMDDEEDESGDEEMSDTQQDDGATALSTGGFNWNAENLDRDDTGVDSDGGATVADPKRKKRKPAIKVDRTGDLDVNGPQTTSDFERLLLGQPDVSELWIQYMAFHMRLSELAKAREIGERALRTINITEQVEKLNIWIALINLENAYGNDETLTETFQRACQYADPQEVHERLASIYIQSGKTEKADELFQVIVKKFSQTLASWSNYAHFLFNTLSSPDRARALLPRAMQSLPPFAHLALTTKFASLEFHSSSGSPERGRTIFEGLLSTYPKKLDLWNQLLDLEIQQGDKEIIRGVFERVLRGKGLKAKAAKGWFKRWNEWEAKEGDKKSQQRVAARAAEWVRDAEAKKAAGDE